MICNIVAILPPCHAFGGGAYDARGEHLTGPEGELVTRLSEEHDSLDPEATPCSNRPTVDAVILVIATYQNNLVRESRACPCIWIVVADAVLVTCVRRDRERVSLEKEDVCRTSEVREVSPTLSSEFGGICRASPPSVQARLTPELDLHAIHRGHLYAVGGVRTVWLPRKIVVERREHLRNARWSGQDFSLLPLKAHRPPA